MRYGVLAFALAAFLASPALAGEGCWGGHKTVAEQPTQSEIAETPVKQSKPAEN